MLCYTYTGTYPEKDFTVSGDKPAALLLAVRVYILADKYDVADLAQEALARFRRYATTLGTRAASSPRSAKSTSTPQRTKTTYTAWRWRSWPRQPPPVRSPRRKCSLNRSTRCPRSEWFWRRRSPSGISCLIVSTRILLASTV